MFSDTPLATADSGLCTICGPDKPFKGDAFDHVVSMHASDEEPTDYEARQSQQKVSINRITNALIKLRTADLDPQSRLEEFDRILQDMYTHRTKLVKEATK